MPIAVRRAEIENGFEMLYIGRPAKAVKLLSVLSSTEKCFAVIHFIHWLLSRIVVERLEKPYIVCHHGSLPLRQNVPHRDRRQSISHHTLNH